MANIKINTYGEILIEGPLIQDDIVFLNRLESDTNICFENTKHLTSELLKQITNEKLTFSIIGGLERTKSKYDNDSYQKRTYHTKDKLIKILEYFEHIEKGITPEMSEMQKCMYIYCCIMQDTTYVTSYRDADIASMLIENSLTGNLYHKLTCAGVALTFKEMLDRQSITCEYLNKRSSHSFNRVTINGKKYGIDLTWDLNEYEKTKSFTFNNFGTQDAKSFYRGYHDLSYEADETMDELETFSQEEINHCFNSIKSKLEQRKKHKPFIEEISKEEKIRALTLQHTYSELQREQSFIALIRYLKRNNLIEENDHRLAFANKRYPIVADIVGPNIASLENVEGIDEDYQYNRTQKEDFAIKALKAIDKYLELYIRSFFESSSIYASMLKYVSVEENENLYIIYSNLKSKIEYFNSIRDIVTKMGYQEELDYFVDKVKREEERRKQEESDKHEEKSQYDYDYDFLAGIISPLEMLYIKDYIEIQENKELSIEEFKDYFTNPSFMRTIFNRKWDFTDSELRNLLIEVYEENISAMINLLNQRKNLPKEQPSKSEVVDTLKDTTFFDDFDWGEIIEDEQNKMTFF